MMLLSAESDGRSKLRLSARTGSSFLPLSQRPLVYLTENCHALAGSSSLGFQAEAFPSPTSQMLLVIQTRNVRKTLLDQVKAPSCHRGQLPASEKAHMLERGGIPAIWIQRPSATEPEGRARSIANDGLILCTTVK